MASKLSCKCGATICSHSDLCFYEQGYGQWHLIAKPESQSKLSAAVTLTPHPDFKSRRFNPNKLLCCSCGVDLGNESKVGPNEEAVFCFQYKKVTLQLSSFSPNMKWGAALALYPHIERRMRTVLPPGVMHETESGDHTTHPPATITPRQGAASRLPSEPLSAVGFSGSAVALETRIAAGRTGQAPELEPLPASGEPVQVYARNDALRLNSMGPHLERMPSFTPLRRASSADIASTRLRSLIQSGKTPRGYQVELYVEAMQRDAAVVVLPTGAGKTLVAAMVAKRTLELNPGRVVVLLADRVPLVHQQAEVLRTDGGLRVKEFTGENSSAFKASTAVQLEELLRDTDVLALTAQVFLNKLSEGFGLHHCCLLIFDEAHHAVGKHPFALILSRFYSLCPPAARPHLLGLTASPGGQTSYDRTVRQLDELASYYNHAKFYTPVLHRAEMEKFTNRADTVCLAVPPTLDEARFQTELNAYLSQLLTEISLLASIYCSTFVKFSYPPDENMVRGELRKLLDQSKTASCPELGVATEHGLEILSMYDRTVVIGPRASRRELANYQTKLRGKHSQEAKVWLMEKLGWPLAWQRGSAGGDFFSQSAGMEDGREEYSSRVKALVNEIRAVMARSTNFRILVFVQRKTTGRALVRVLETVSGLEKLKPGLLVGHSGFDGMSWEEEQRPILERFKSGVVKLLVATSVAEEGIDVTACNAVIRFNGAVSVTSVIQSRGRARKKSSRFVLLVDPKEQQLWEKTRIEERLMVDTITSMQGGTTAETKRLVKELLEQIRVRVSDSPSDGAEPSKGQNQWANLDTEGHTGQNLAESAPAVAAASGGSQRQVSQVTGGEKLVVVVHNVPRTAREKEVVQALSGHASVLQVDLRSGQQRGRAAVHLVPPEGQSANACYMAICRDAKVQIRGRPLWLSHWLSSGRRDLRPDSHQSAHASLAAQEASRKLPGREGAEGSRKVQLARCTLGYLENWGSFIGVQDLAPAQQLSDQDSSLPLARDDMSSALAEVAPRRQNEAGRLQAHLAGTAGAGAESAAPSLALSWSSERAAVAVDVTPGELRLELATSSLEGPVVVQRNHLNQQSFVLFMSVKHPPWIHHQQVCRSASQTNPPGTTDFHGHSTEQNALIMRSAASACFVYRLEGRLEDVSRFENLLIWLEGSGIEVVDGRIGEWAFGASEAGAPTWTNQQMPHGRLSTGQTGAEDRQECGREEVSVKKTDSGKRKFGECDKGRDLVGKRNLGDKRRLSEVQGLTAAERLRTVSGFGQTLDCIRFYLEKDRAVVREEAKLGFAVRYLVECFESKCRPGVKLPVAFYKLLGSMDPQKAVWALLRLPSLVERFSEPMEALHLAAQEPMRFWGPSLLPLPKGHLAVPHATVTPTRVIFSHPMPVPLNSAVLRNKAFKKVKPEDVGLSFLHIDFREDNGGAICGYDEGNLEQIRRFLEDGVEVGGKRFLFLAASRMQMMSQSCWMTSLEPDEVRQSLGRPSNIRSVAHYLAYLGEALTAAEEDERPLPSREVASEGEVPIVPGPASAAPSRPPAGSRVSQRHLPGQSSMRQVASPAASANQRLCLDRHVIMLLQSLGVKDEVFEHLQEQHVSGLLRLFSDREAAWTVLRDQCCQLAGCGAVSALNAMGADALREPLLHGVLTAVYHQQIRALVEEAAIWVPQGRVLPAVPDGSGLLNDGEIFVQLSGPVPSPWGVRVEEEDGWTGGESRGALRGPCALLRRPGLLPGDIQLVEARADSATQAAFGKDYVDVIVFSTKGDSQIPPWIQDSVSADGSATVLSILWQPDLLPAGTLRASHGAPAVSPLVDPGGAGEDADSVLPASGPITARHMASCFLSQLASRRGGEMTEGHVALCDSLTDGPRHPDCQRLAPDLISRAKSAAPMGWTAVTPPEPLPGAEAPDHVVSPGFRNSESGSLISGLRRRIRSLLRIEEIRGRLRRPCVPDPMVLIAGYEDHVNGTKHLYRWYREALHELMARFGIGSECELVAACSVVPRGSWDTAGEGQKIPLQLEELLQSFRRMFDSAASEPDPGRAEPKSGDRGEGRGESGGEVQDRLEEANRCRTGSVGKDGRQREVYARAAAWYWTAYADPEPEARCLTFAWVVMDIILEGKGHEVAGRELQTRLLPRGSAPLAEASARDGTSGRSIGTGSSQPQAPGDAPMGRTPQRRDLIGQHEGPRGAGSEGSKSGSPIRERNRSSSGNRPQEGPLTAIDQTLIPGNPIGQRSQPSPAIGQRARLAMGGDPRAPPALGELITDSMVSEFHGKKQRLFGSLLQHIALFEQLEGCVENLRENWESDPGSSAGPALGSVEGLGSGLDLSICLVGPAATGLLDPDLPGADFRLVPMPGGSSKRRQGSSASENATWRNPLSESDRAVLLGKMLPVLEQDFPGISLVREPGGAIIRFEGSVGSPIPFTISCQDASLQVETMLQKIYSSCPSLLLLLRAVVQWVSLAGLAGQGRENFFSQDSFVWLFLGFCEQRGHFSGMSLRAADSRSSSSSLSGQPPIEMSSAASLDFWTTAWDRISLGGRACPSADGLQPMATRQLAATGQAGTTPLAPGGPVEGCQLDDGTWLGDVLLAFFSELSRPGAGGPLAARPRFPAGLQAPAVGLGTGQASEGAPPADVREASLFARHLLTRTANVADLLTGVTSRKQVQVPRPIAAYVRGAESFTALRFALLTGYKASVKFGGSPWNLALPGPLGERRSQPGGGAKPRSGQGLAAGLETGAETGVETGLRSAGDQRPAGHPKMISVDHGTASSARPIRLHAPLYAEIEGEGWAVQMIERHLCLSGDRGSGKGAPGTAICHLFEGAVSDEDLVGFLEYRGPRHSSHIGPRSSSIIRGGLADVGEDEGEPRLPPTEQPRLHTASLLAPVGGDSWQAFAFSKLRAAIWQRRESLQGSLACSGKISILVRVGTGYFLNLAKAVAGEALGCMRVADLEAALTKKQYSANPSPGEAPWDWGAARNEKAQALGPALGYGNDEDEPQDVASDEEQDEAAWPQGKGQVAGRETAKAPKAKKPKERKPAQALFPHVVRPLDDLIAHLGSSGFQKMDTRTSYHATVVDGERAVRAVLDEDLHLVGVTGFPLRWLTASVTFTSAMREPPLGETNHDTEVQESPHTMRLYFQCGRQLAGVDKLRGRLQEFSLLERVDPRVHGSANGDAVCGTVVVAESFQGQVSQVRKVHSNVFLKCPSEGGQLPVRVELEEVEQWDGWDWELARFTSHDVRREVQVGVDDAEVFRWGSAQQCETALQTVWRVSQKVAQHVV